MSEILLGTGLLLLVLCCFTIFSYKAPYGMKAMGALANAACATFLVEAFNLSLLGDVLGMEFLEVSELLMVVLVELLLLYLCL